MSSFWVNWTDENGAARSTMITQSDNTPDPSLPIVLLLHGMGGNIHHMADPDVSPGLTVDLDFTPPLMIDRGWHPYPNIGVWGFISSPPKSVTGWQPRLAQLGYTALNYA